MLACDGIWDCMSSEEAIISTREALAKKSAGQPLSKITEDMFDRIIATDILSSAGVGTDNMTCVIVQLKT